MRVESGVERGAPFCFTFDGRVMNAHPGETIAAALVAAGIRSWRRTAQTASPRGIFCGMGVCFDCTVTVDGNPHMRACLTRVEPDMEVTTQDEHCWVQTRT